MLDHSVLPQPEQVSRFDSSRNSHRLPPTALKLEPSSHNICEKRASNKSPKHWNKTFPCLFFLVYFQTLIAVTSSSDTAGAIVLPHFEGREGSPQFISNVAWAQGSVSITSGKHRYPFSPHSYGNKC